MPDKVGNKYSGNVLPQKTVTNKHCYFDFKMTKKVSFFCEEKVASGKDVFKLHLRS